MSHCVETSLADRKTELGRATAFPGGDAGLRVWMRLSQMSTRWRCDTTAECLLDARTMGFAQARLGGGGGALAASGSEFIGGLLK